MVTKKDTYYIVQTFKHRRKKNIRSTDHRDCPKNALPLMVYNFALNLHAIFVMGYEKTLCIFIHIYVYLFIYIYMYIRQAYKNQRNFHSHFNEICYGLCKNSVHTTTSESIV